MSAARSIGVTSLAGAVGGCTCPPPTVLNDPVRCNVELENEGCLNEGGLARLAFDGVRCGAGVLGKSPGVGRRGVTGGYDISIHALDFSTNSVVVVQDRGA